MFAVRVVFRNEDGEALTGELVNPFKIMVEGTRQVLHITHEIPAQVDVMAYAEDGETLEIHRIPSLAIVSMKEVAYA